MSIEPLGSSPPIPPIPPKVVAAAGDDSGPEPIPLDPVELDQSSVIDDITSAAQAFVANSKDRRWLNEIVGRNVQQL